MEKAAAGHCWFPKSTNACSLMLPAWELDRLRHIFLGNFSWGNKSFQNNELNAFCWSYCDWGLFTPVSLNLRAKNVCIRESKWTINELLLWQVLHSFHCCTWRACAQWLEAWRSSRELSEKIRILRTASKQWRPAPRNPTNGLRQMKRSFCRAWMSPTCRQWKVSLRTSTSPSMSPDCQMPSKVVRLRGPLPGPQEHSGRSVSVKISKPAVWTPEVLLQRSLQLQGVCQARSTRLNLRRERKAVLRENHQSFEMNPVGQLMLESNPTPPTRLRPSPTLQTGENNLPHISALVCCFIESVGTWRILVSCQIRVVCVGLEFLLLGTKSERHRFVGFFDSRDANFSRRVIVPGKSCEFSVTNATKYWRKSLNTSCVFFCESWLTAVLLPWLSVLMYGSFAVLPSSVRTKERAWKHPRPWDVFWWDRVLIRSDSMTRASVFFTESTRLHRRQVWLLRQEVDAAGEKESRGICQTFSEVTRLSAEPKFMSCLNLGLTDGCSLCAEWFCVFAVWG